MLELEELSELVIGAAMEVHRELGPGFLEAVYEEALCMELEMRGLRVRAQVPVQLLYKGRKLRRRHRMDLVVEDCIVVEVKAVEKVLLVHECQLHSYLKACRRTVGFVFNFNVPLMKDGIHRRVLTARSRRLYD
jgi:GxxExxY protein